MHSSRARRRGALLFGICVLATSALLVSQHAPTPNPPADAALQISPPGEAAMRAFLDPETGELIQGHLPPSKADSQEIQEALSRSTDGLVTVEHPDGSMSVHLQGRFQNASVARIDSSGKLHLSCVDSPEAADGRCQHAQPPSEPAEVR